MNGNNSFNRSSVRTPLRKDSPAISFIDNRLPSYHPAFNTGKAPFESSQGRYVALSPPSTRMNNIVDLVPRPGGHLDQPAAFLRHQHSPRPVACDANDMSFWSDILPRAMEMIQNENTPCPISKTRWAIRQFSTWEDIQDQLKSARNHYDFSDGNKHVGWARAKMRGVLDKHVATLQQGARLVPEIDIAKPVVGAIKLVLDAYKKASEVREEMQTSFENLAEVFEEIDFSMRTYPKDQNIVVASTHLIRAIVVSVENAIEFYTSHQFVRAANATFSGSDYKKLLVQNLNDVKACCASLEKQSQRSFAHRVTNDSEYLKHQSARMIYQQHVSSTSLEQLVENSLRCNEGLADLKNIVLSLLSDRQNIVNVGPHSRVPSPSPSPVTPLLGPPREITSYLRIPRIDDEDMRDVVENSGFIMHGDNGKAQQLLENRLFSSWMSFQGSSKLLVHDNLEPPYDITSFSVVCTLLTHMLRRPGGTSISLVFFCGRHLAGDVYHGGSAMIRSLISQLLFQSGLYPFQYDSEYSVEDLERDDIEFLCDIFTWLIRRLPGNSNVFCIIDGISLYEQRFMQGMDAVVLALVELVEDDYDGRASLKLLVTSPQPTYKVKKAFDSHPAELLDMEELPVVGDGLGLLGLGERLASDMEVRHDWMRNKGPR